MKRSILILLAAIIVLISLVKVIEVQKNPASATKAIGSLYSSQARALDSFLTAYPRYFYDSSYAIRNQKYKELAYYFKRAAGFLIYFEPELYYKEFIAPFKFEKNQRKGSLATIPDDWIFTGPVGNEPDSFLLKSYSKDDSIYYKSFITEVTNKYRKTLVQINYKKYFSNLDASGIFDALRIEIFRISALDMGNSDFIIEAAGLPSLNGSLDSWLLFTNEFVKLLHDEQHFLKRQWITLSGKARNYLANNKDFKTFNRMVFIKSNLIPLSQYLNNLQVALGIPFVQKFSAIRADAKHIYDKNFFNPNFFAPNDNAYYSEEKASLGELLFFDPILSDNNKRACASCHKPGLAFTDGLVKSISFEFKELPRNAPTIINAGFQKKQFWDLRATSLEDQLDSVVNNASELHSSFEHVIEKINSSPQYIKLFNKAFPKTTRNGIKREDVKNAIGVYERTLVGLNSRFDEFMRGNGELTGGEVNGFNLYLGKARCGTCHFAPLFNGTLPPFFNFTDIQAIGVPLKDTMVKFKIDPDAGRFKLTGDSFTKFFFKTPTIRNSALTAPYMHNGVYKTLEQVIDFYDQAGGTKFENDMRPDMVGLPGLTLIALKLNLSESEKKELVSFLRALTDTSSANGVPGALPVLTGKYAFLNKRVIGGVY
ncbi:MAG: cytochrome c peroxidase [Chitinophagaceae bacterium]